MSHKIGFKVGKYEAYVNTEGASGSVVVKALLY
jgi:hypothetical protein